MADVRASRSQADGIPARAGLDRTARLLLEGYPYLAERRRCWGTGPSAGDGSVELRLLGERAVCVGGPEAVRLFYDPERFRRHDAVPRPLASTLFGRGAVHLLDGEAHRHRKALLLGLLDPAAAREIAAVADRLWQVAVDRWRDGRQVVVFDEAVRVIGVAICQWAGLPLTPENARRRVWDLEQIVDGFAAIGPRHAAARLARRRSQRWDDPAGPRCPGRPPPGAPGLGPAGRRLAPGAGRHAPGGADGGRGAAKYRPPHGGRGLVRVLCRPGPAPAANGM